MGLNIKVTSETFGGTDKSWIQPPMGLNTMRGIMLRVGGFTDNHVKNGYIPSGTALGKYTSGAHTGKYGPYDDSATDGRQALAGHLFDDVAVDTVAGTVSGASDVGCALFWTGVVRLAKLPVPSGGVTTGTVDTAGKADVASWIRYE